MDVNGVTNAFNVATSQTATATVTGSAIDTTGYQGSLKLILNSAAGTGTTPTLDVKVQTSDTTTSGDFADVTGLAFTQVTDATDSFQQMQVEKGAIKKYIRVIATIAGATPSFAFSVCAVGEKQYN